MRIDRVETWTQVVELSRPYTIASRSINDVELGFVRLLADDGSIGLGSASPAEEVTGESTTACWEALDDQRLSWLIGCDVRLLVAHCRRLESELSETPAARVAVEMALFDLLAQSAGVAVVDLLGRCHERFPTSITIGIKPDVQAVLDEANEYLSRGFDCLKVKIGLDLDHDVEVLSKLRARSGSATRIRVDANRGYDPAETERLCSLVEPCGIELIEQPVPVEQFWELRRLPEPLRRIIAADESLVREGDALELLQQPLPCGIFNIKLMKCGGLSTALAIAKMARVADVELMWGCMDESVISIAAALHVAYACPNTRYLDLDGSFDLATDPAQGGVDLENGGLSVTDASGLGVTLEA